MWKEKELKNMINMKNLKFKTLYGILIMLFFIGCADVDKYDGLILTDKNTGKQYLMKHNIGDNYFIDEKRTIISGDDTITVFGNNY